MAFQAGKGGYLAIGTSGSETNITTYTTKVSFPTSVAKNDTSTMGTSDETSVPGLMSHTVSFSGKWDPTLHTTLTALLAVVGKSIVFGPAGSGSGSQRRKALGYLSKYGPSADVGSADDWDAEFTVSGAVTNDVFP